MKKQVPDDDEENMDRKTVLAIECIAAIQPALTAEDVCKAINVAFLAENPDCYADLKVDADALSDVVDWGDKQKMEQYTAEVALSRAKKSVVMYTRDSRVPKRFKSAGTPKYTPAQKKQP